MAPIDELANALNQREITDDEGQPAPENETPAEESSASEYQTPAEDDTQAVKPAETEVRDTQPKTEESEIDLVELASDETGKRYVPETRFKEVYGKMKDLERALKEKETQPAELPPLPEIKSEKPLPKADQVEIELLRATMPQFNPESSEYSREMDELGFAIYQANKGITRVEAARRAVTMAKKIQGQVAKVQEEARTVKAIQSDQGITGRVTSREPVSDVPGEEASPEEMEQWLKAHGQW